MKIKIDDTVYLQKYDIAFIMHELNSIPAAVIDAIFGGGAAFILSGPEDSKRFAYSFEGELADWLMKQGWIVDFNDYSLSKPHVIDKLIKEGQAQHKKAIKQFNASDEKYRLENFDEKSDEFRKEEHRLASLSLMRDYLRGKEIIKLPT